MKPEPPSTRSRYIAFPAQAGTHLDLCRPNPSTPEAKLGTLSAQDDLSLNSCRSVTLGGPDALRLPRRPTTSLGSPRKDDGQAGTHLKVAHP